MAATIVLGTNSWVTEAEANSYMEGRVKAGDYWDDGGADNIPALITAFKWLTGTPAYSFPVIVSQDMKDGQSEYALFLLQHQPDLDLRMGLQAQGVKVAGIVKESYREIQGIAVPPIVHELLRDYTTEVPFYILPLERDEEENTNYDAFGNLERDPNAET